MMHGKILQDQKVKFYKVQKENQIKIKREYDICPFIERLHQLRSKLSKIRKLNPLNHHCIY